MAQVGFGSQKIKSDIDSFPDEIKLGVFEWRVGAGYAWFLNDNVSIEPLLTYGGTSSKLGRLFRESKPS